MASFKNTTSQSLSVRNKAGESVSIKPDGTYEGELDDKSPRNKALLHAKAVVQIKDEPKRAAPSPAPSSAPAKTN